MKLITYLKRRQERESDAKNALIVKITESTTYHIAWSTEELYRTAFRLDYISQAISDLTPGDNGCPSDERVCQEYIKHAERFLEHEYNVRENSSGTMHREVSTWKYQEMFWLKRFFSETLETINAEK